MTDITSETPEAEAPVNEALSDEQALEALTQTDEPADAPAEDADQSKEEVSEDEQDEADPDNPAIDPPRSWGAEERAVFAGLPPDVQKIILDREEDRDRATSKALTEAGQARKQAEQEAKAIAEFRAQADALLPQALQTFKSRWDGVDWAEEARLDPVRAFQMKAQHDQEQAQLQQLQAANDKAQQLEHQEHVKAVATELQTLAPDLLDPKEGQARIGKLQQFLGEQGITPDALKWATGPEIALANDAMKYRELQAKAKDAITRTPHPPARPVKPTGSTRANPEQRDASTVVRRFAQTGKADDAVAVILAKGL